MRTCIPYFFLPNLRGHDGKVNRKKLRARGDGCPKETLSSGHSTYYLIVTVRACTKSVKAKPNQTPA